MQKLTIVLAATAAVGFATPAFAKCMDDLRAAGDNLRKEENVARAYRNNPVYRRQYQKLISAARTFAANDMESRCSDVVEGIKELAKKHAKDDKTRADRDARTKRSKNTAEKKKRDMERKKRVAYLKSAKPLTQAAFSVERLTGMDVRNHKDVDLGDIDDVILRPNGQHTAIIGRGGFIGMGVVHYAMPFSKLKIQPGTDDYSAVVVLDMTAKQLEARPKVEMKDGRWIRVADKKPVEENEEASTDDGGKKKDN